mmetsp:Transcript_18049/g.24753  ORF Transcript_18049/g.24753 Transcript_18049/m.24753 type:complete len:289 (+) Transcript_18049:883-1749(+)
MCSACRSTLRRFPCPLPSKALGLPVRTSQSRTACTRWTCSSMSWTSPWRCTAVSRCCWPTPCCPMLAESPRVCFGSIPLRPSWTSGTEGARPAHTERHIGSRRAAKLISSCFQAQPLPTSTANTRNSPVPSSCRRCSLWATTNADGTTATRRMWRLWRKVSRTWTSLMTCCGWTLSTQTARDISRGIKPCSRTPLRCRGTCLPTAARWSLLWIRISNETATTTSTRRRSPRDCTSSRPTESPTSMVGAGPALPRTWTSPAATSGSGGPSSSVWTSTRGPPWIYSLGMI